MNLNDGRTRVLNPLERFSEIVFGLIMVLSFTCAISVTESGRDDVRAMLIGAIGCNLAWGIIDAAFYLIACLTEHGRHALLLRGVQQASTPEEAQRAITDALPHGMAGAMRPDDFVRIHAHVKQLPEPPARAGLTGENWRGALAVFLLVFLSTFPVVIPFIFIKDAHLAVRISNLVANVMLFGVGWMLARYAGLRPMVTGIAMVGIGAVLVAITIALGG